MIVYLFEEKYDNNIDFFYWKIIYIFVFLHNFIIFFVSTYL